MACASPRRGAGDLNKHKKPKAVNDMDAWYDNEEAMRKILTDKGLDGLREIAQARAKSVGECEREWFVNGRVYLRREGSLWVVSDGVASDPEFSALGADKRLLIDVQECLDTGVIQGWSCRPFSLPKVEKCSWCGHGWTLATVHDYDHLREMHGTCVGLRNLQHGWEQLQEIVKRAEIPSNSMNMTSNRYWGSNDITGPWMLLKTPKGNIRIGWRKRVISIDWSALRVEVSLADLPDDVTKDETSIHAWGEDKAVEYLRIIYNSRSKRTDKEQ